jgi:hypothetical protein
MIIFAKDGEMNDNLRNNSKFMYFHLLKRGDIILFDRLQHGGVIYASIVTCYQRF